MCLLREDAPLWRAAGRRLFAPDGPAPYWGFAWASGQALARYLMDHPQWVRGRRVVDFGSGSGIAAIAAAKAGAAEVLATDLDPVALAAIELNAALNGVSVAMSPANLIDGEQHPWEVLLVADVCYRWVQRQWVSSLADRERLVLIADPGRGGLPVDKLEELARFAVRTVPELEHPDLVEAAVYRFRKGGIPERIPPTQ